MQNTHITRTVLSSLQLMSLHADRLWTQYSALIEFKVKKMCNIYFQSTCPTGQRKKPYFVNNGYGFGSSYVSIRKKTFLFKCLILDWILLAQFGRSVIIDVHGELIRANNVYIELGSSFAKTHEKKNNAEQNKTREQRKMSLTCVFCCCCCSYLSSKCALSLPFSCFFRMCARAIR